MSSTPSFILTLKLEQPVFESLDELRMRYFPPERNFLPAHVTLFHALPGDQEAAVRQTLHTFCSETQTLRLSFPRLRFLGRGVAVEVGSPELIKLRGRLAAVWGRWLGAQDRQVFRPHVTIQNKVAADEARRLYERLNGAWEPLSGRGEGLLLWRYLGGPWKLAGEFPFVEEASP